MRSKFLIFIASATILAALAGCSRLGGPNGNANDPGNNGSSSSNSGEAKVGEPFALKQLDGTAQITVVSATYGPSLGGPFESPADNGGYLILDVLWETSEGTTSSNPLYFRVKDVDGREADLALLVDSGLSSGDVPAGDKARGNVAFDVGPGPYTVVATDALLQEKARLTVTATPR